MFKRLLAVILLGLTIGLAGCGINYEKMDKEVNAMTLELDKMEERTSSIESNYLKEAEKYLPSYSGINALRLKSHDLKKEISSFKKKSTAAANGDVKAEKVIKSLFLELKRDFGVVKAFLAETKEDVDYLVAFSKDETFRKTALSRTDGLVSRKESIDAVFTQALVNHESKSTKINALKAEVNSLLNSLGVTRMDANIALKYRTDEWVSEVTKSIDAKVEKVKSLDVTEIKSVAAVKGELRVKISGASWDADDPYDYEKKFHFSEQTISEFLANKLYQSPIYNGEQVVKTNSIRWNPFLAELTKGESTYKSFSFDTHAVLWIEKAYTRYRVKFEYKTDTVTTKTEWKTVSESEFYNYQVGQVVYSKPYGMFADEVSIGMQGMVGNPHYGQFKSQSNGNRMWEWYGKYAFMRDMLGGNSISYSHYSHTGHYRSSPRYTPGNFNPDAYHYSNDRPRTYYGNNNGYARNGKSSYSDSEFLDKKSNSHRYTQEKHSKNASDALKKHKPASDSHASSMVNKGSLSDLKSKAEAKAPSKIESGSIKSISQKTPKFNADLKVPKGSVPLRNTRPDLSKLKAKREKSLTRIAKIKIADAKKKKLIKKKFVSSGYGFKKSSFKRK